MKMKISLCLFISLSSWIAVAVDPTTSSAAAADPPAANLSDEPLALCDPSQLYFSTQWQSGPIPTFFLSPVNPERTWMEPLKAQPLRITFFHFRPTVQRSRSRGGYNGFRFSLLLDVPLSQQERDEPTTMEETEMVLATLQASKARSFSRVQFYGSLEQLANTQHDTFFTWSIGRNAYRVLRNVERCQEKGRWVAYSIAYNLPADSTGRFRIVPLTARGQLMHQNEFVTQRFRFEGILGHRFQLWPNGAHVGVFESDKQNNGFKPALPSFADKLASITYDIIFDLPSLNTFMKGFWLKSDSRHMKLVFHHFRNSNRESRAGQTGLRIMLVGPNNFEWTLMDRRDSEAIEYDPAVMESTITEEFKVLNDEYFKESIRLPVPSDLSSVEIEPEYNCRASSLSVRHSHNTDRSWTHFRFDRIGGGRMYSFMLWLTLPPALPSGRYYFKFQDYDKPVRGGATRLLREVYSNAFEMLSLQELREKIESYPIRGSLDGGAVDPRLRALIQNEGQTLELDEEDLAVADSMDIPSAPLEDHFSALRINEPRDETSNWPQSWPMSDTESQASFDSATLRAKEGNERFTRHMLNLDNISESPGKGETLLNAFEELS